MITCKFNLAAVKRAATPLLGFVPFGHNDGSSLFISCRQNVAGARAVAAQLDIPGCTVEVSSADRLGSFKDLDNWRKQGQHLDWYVTYSKV